MCVSVSFCSNEKISIDQRTTNNWDETIQRSERFFSRNSKISIISFSCVIEEEKSDICAWNKCILSTTNTNSEQCVTLWACEQHVAHAHTLIHGSNTCAINMRWWLCFGTDRHRSQLTNPIEYVHKIYDCSCIFISFIFSLINSSHSPRSAQLQGN